MFRFFSPSTDVKVSYLGAQEPRTKGRFIPQGAEQGSAADATCHYYWQLDTYKTKDVL